MDPVRVKAISQVDDRTFAIVWNDARRNLFDVVSLRRACPCAVCIDEWTRQKKLRPDDVSESVRPVRIDSVGTYALKIAFTDGHDTGIYPFTLLRSLGS